MSIYPISFRVLFHLYLSFLAVAKYAQYKANLSDVTTILKKLLNFLLKFVIYQISISKLCSCSILNMV